MKIFTVLALVLSVFLYKVLSVFRDFFRDPPTVLRSVSKVLTLEPDFKLGIIPRICVTYMDKSVHVVWLFDHTHMHTFVRIRNAYSWKNIQLKVWHKGQDF